MDYINKINYKNLFMYLNIFGISFVLFACSIGTNRGINANSYGNLQSYTQIGLGGVESGNSITTTDLQNLATAQVCPQILLNGEVVIKQYPFLRAGQLVCDNVNKSYINTNGTLPDSEFYAVRGNIDSFVTLGIAPSVNMYRIIYNTPGQTMYYSGGAVSNETVSGLVVVPNIPESSIKGIVLYYHPTALSKSNVPSYTNQTDQITLASVYAAQGYIAIAPDYVGQGVDTGVMHPYVIYPQNNALAGINMLKAARTFLNQTGVLSSTTSKNLYITSYSEGGAYALWASRMLNGSNRIDLTDNNLTLKLTVGISGAYDLSNAMIPFAYANANNSENPSINTYNVSPGMNESSDYYIPPIDITIPAPQPPIANLTMALNKSGLSSYAFAAFINYNFTSAAYPVLFTNANFLQMQTCLNIESYVGSIINPNIPWHTPMPCPLPVYLPNLFLNTGAAYNEANIGLTIGSSAMYNANFFTGGETSGATVAKIDNGGTSANSISQFANPVLTDPSLMAIIEAADTYKYYAPTPTKLIYMKYDSTVTNVNSIHACANISGSFNSLTDCIEIDNTHLYQAQGVPTPDSRIQLALLLEHGNATYILQLAALTQIQNYP